MQVLLPEDLTVVPIQPKPPTPIEERPKVLEPTLLTARTEPVTDDLPIINMEPDSTSTITLPPEHVGISGPLVKADPAPLPIRLVGRNVMPNTADYYPPQEIREGNEGTAEVRSCVDTSGKLDGTPNIETSSGRPSLDKAAVRLAKDGKYARAMRGDMPVPNCYRFRVTFTLH
jgi:TonB family protein